MNEVNKVLDEIEQLTKEYMKLVPDEEKARTWAIRTLRDKYDKKTTN